MAQINYTATFANGETANRPFARKLTHAYRVTFVYTATDTPDSAVMTKVGFSGSEELARKAVKLAKRYTVRSLEVVEVVEGAPVISKAKPKAEKKAKPFAAGEQVIVHTNIVGTVEKVGRLYVYVTLPGFKTARKYAFAEVTNHSPEPSPVALAA